MEGIFIFKGTLADYNLTFDKLRSKTRPEDIKNMYLLSNVL